MRRHTLRHMRPKKTEIRLRMRAVWSESPLSTWRNCASLAMKCAQWRFWPDCVNARVIWIAGRICLKLRCPTLQSTITKTCLYNFDPLKPNFYIVKLGFTGVYIIFLILLKNIDCGYSLESPRRGGSNEYHNLCFEQKYEKYQIFFFFFFFFFDCKIF